MLFQHENLLINGDNIDGLQLLEGIKQYDFILIDPPYRSENREFLYNDVSTREQWKRSIGKRLKMAHGLLTEDGAIAIHIDDREYHTLRLVCDDIFGEDNYVNTFAVKRATKNLNNQFEKVARLNRAFEFVVVYRKSNAFYYKNAFKPSTDKRKEGYWTSFQSNADRPTMRYEIGGVNIEKGQWKWSKERGLRAYENYLTYERTASHKMTLKEYWEKHKGLYEESTGFALEFVREHKGRIHYWVKPADHILMDTDMMEFYINENSGKRKYGFDTVKNLQTTKKLISMFTTSTSNILDFYAGSGTTGHAVLELNHEDKGSRHFTLITNNENEICSSITFPRIKKTSAIYEVPFDYFILEEEKEGE